MSVDQRKLVEIIANDNLDQFIRLQHNKHLVNIQILPFECLNIPNDNKNYCPKGPTTLIYCVLCQSSKILEYIIRSEKKFQPEYFKEVEGFTPLLYSILTKDTRCFYLLADRIFGGSDLEESKKLELAKTLIRASCINENYETLIQLLTYVNSFDIDYSELDLLKISYTKLDPILALICIKFGSYSAETREMIDKQSEKDSNSHMSQRLSDYYKITSLGEDEIIERYNDFVKNNFPDIQFGNWSKVQQEPTQEIPQETIPVDQNQDNSNSNENPEVNENPN